MKKHNPISIYLAEPALEDRVLLVLALHLKNRLPWLNKAFGQAHKLAITKDNRTTYFPAYPAEDETAGKEYVKLWPDEHIGNFSFFELQDQHNVIEWGKAKMVNSVFEFKVSLIVSFNLKTIWPDDWKMRSTANVVNEIFNRVLAKFSAPAVSINADRYFHNTENVYKGYTIEEIPTQYNMRPYGVCRIDLTARYSPICLAPGEEDDLLAGIGYDVIENTQVVYP